jgi:hypothetical protein
MGLSVVTVAAGGLPVVEVTTGGLPVTEAANRFGIAVTKVAAGGLPVSGLAAAAPPVALTYRTHVENSANLAVYTFNAVAIGAAEATRRVHVGIAANTGVVMPSGLTINGAAATLNATANAANSNAQIYTGLVPTGTTCTIEVSYASTRAHQGITVWTSVGLGSNAAFGSGGVQNPQGSQDINLDVPTKVGGFILCQAFYTSDVGVLTWSPAAITPRHSTMIEASGFHYAASGSTDGTTFDVRTSFLGSSSAQAPLVAASFGV